MRIVTLTLFLSLVVIAQSCSGYPKTANIFNSIPTLEQARMLSRWDLICLPVDVKDRFPSIIDTIRTYNPDALILVYFPSTFIWADWQEHSQTAQRFGEKISQEDWWLRDNFGEIVGNASTLWYTNLTTVCRRNPSGQRLIEWLADYIAEEILGTGVWDGILIDGLTYSGVWLNTVPEYFRQQGAQVDANRDGIADHPDSLTAWWRRGLDQFLQRLRNRVGSSYILTGEGHSRMGQHLNGGIREDFPYMHGNWNANMTSDYGYLTMCSTWLHEPQNCSMIIAFHDDPNNTIYQPRRTSNYERHLRFTLSSALLGDGYYSMEHRQGDALWWEDYYDLDLGLPLEEARCDTIAVPNGTVNLWSRRFQNGIVYCNPSSNYVRIGNTWLAPQDGLIISHKKPLQLDLEIIPISRTLSQRQRSFTFRARVVNPCHEAYNLALWSRVVAGDDTVSMGIPRTFLIGAHDTADVNLGVPMGASVPPGTYKLVVFAGSLSLEPVACDTLYFTKIISFDTSPNRGVDSTGSQSSLKIRDLPITGKRLEVVIEGNQRPRYMIDIFDVRGRRIGGLEKSTNPDEISIDLDSFGGHRISSGVYFVVVRFNDNRLVKKIVVLR